MLRRAIQLGRLAVFASVGVVTARAVRSSRRARALNRPADVEFMYAIHAALRRDLDRLRFVSRQLNGSHAVPATVSEGWTRFRRELEYHHHAEDEELWPMLRQRATDAATRATIDATVDEMVQEHRLIPPALDAVDRALAGGADLAPSVDALARLVEEHLDHEERSALPLVESRLSDAEC